MPRHSKHAPNNHTAHLKLPYLHERIQANFDRQALMRTFGASLASVQPGVVEIVMPFAEHLVQQQGALHAGVSAALADSACGYAALTLMPDDADVVSVEFKINLLAPAFGERFLARGRVLRAGRTITVCSGEVIAVQAIDKTSECQTEETVVAVMQATMMRVPAVRS